MSYTLTDGEAVIKSWDYASAKRGFFNPLKTTANLTVTNRRLIAQTQNKRAFEHDEVPLDAVKSLSFSHSKRSNLTAILIMLFGMIAAVAGVVLATGGNGTLMIVGIVASVLGLTVFAIGIRRLNEGAFTLVITTEGLEGTPLALGAVKATVRRKKQKRIRVKLNHDAMEEIADELGAIVLKYKNV